MSSLLPYAIIIGIVVIFFGVCYVVFSGNSGKKEMGNGEVLNCNDNQFRRIKQNGITVTDQRVKTSVAHERHEPSQNTAWGTTQGETVRRVRQTGGTAVHNKRHAVRDLEATYVLPKEDVEFLAAQEKKEQERSREENLSTSRREKEDLGAVVAADLAEKQAVRAARAKTAVQHVLAANEKQREIEKTQIINRQDMRRVLQDGRHSETAASRHTENTPGDQVHPQATVADMRGQQPSPVFTAAEISPVIQQCVDDFLQHFGKATAKRKALVTEITVAAFTYVGCRSDRERQELIEPLLAHEALHNMQKAYVAHPQEEVKEIALMAFKDAVRKTAATTRHFIAVEALKVLPYLSLPHYKILAILFTFLYSRNTRNVDKESFCSYLDSHVLPFQAGLPMEKAYYQQLGYYQCTVTENKETRFAEILRGSYPLLFEYRGMTPLELQDILQGQSIPSEYVVTSFNSDLIKLALIDESMAKAFFNRIHIQDRRMQQRLLQAVKSRPVDFSGEAALNIMENISPVLADLSDLWDSSQLRVSTLSLLGLYLAHGYIHSVTGEEVDLSRWFE